MRGWVCGLIPGQLSFHTEAMDSSCILPLERPDTIEALLDIMGSTASVFFSSEDRIMGIQLHKLILHILNIKCLSFTYSLV